ncbi:TolC family protein [Dyadobacter frigoris]|uniref:TolC family protein n=1 Tax=Dyadobacter frigoris TaxID=2576211 RepID=A0A4U6D458_9BACT|nr:TolC family protein [Dyadobacter frigoris]TKT92022.1 TolC family protein [Dyadobacter frigoris]
MINSLPKSAFLAFMLCGLVLFQSAYGQTNVPKKADNTYSLEDCIRIALETNPQVKQSEIQVQRDNNIHDQSRWQRWPSLSFNAVQGFNSGRNIDPFTNQFVQQNISQNQFQLGSSVILFSGFQLKNTVKRNEINIMASQKDLDAARNDIMLNVALSYLQVISNEELIGVAQRQVDASNLQVGRTAKLVEAGTLAESNLFDLKAQLANDELTLVNAQNNLETAKLSLKQLMNMPGSDEINLIKIAVADPNLRTYDATIQQIYETAMSNLPQMKAAELRTEAAKKNIEIIRGSAMPTLTLNGGINTAFSSVAPKERFISDGSPNQSQIVPSTSDYILLNDQKYPIIQTVSVPGGALKHFGYLDQLNFNRNSSVNLSLRIPIFTNFQVRYNLANAKLQQCTTEFQAQQVQLTIRKNVEQAYIDMNNAAKRYSATANQVRALTEAFRISQVRFDVGAINSVEYNIAKANLDRANGNLIQTKYDYVFRTKVLDFYMNRPLSDF